MNEDKQGKSVAALQFGRRLSAAMEGKVRAKVARAVGIAPQTLDNYLNGRMPNADVGLALAAALGVSLHWLVHGTEADTGLHDLDDDWTGLPQYPLYALRRGAKPVVMNYVPIHRDWLNRTASTSGPLWVTQMPASTLDAVPAEGDMIVCCDSAEPHGEGLYLYRYSEVPVVRRFIAHGASAPGVMDLTMSGAPGMELIGRVLGAIKLQPAC